MTGTPLLVDPLPVRFAGLLVVSTALMSAAACGAEAVPAGDGRVVQAGDVTVLVSERPDGGMDALAGGRLEVVGGCLGLATSVVVWPYGTDVVSEEPLQIDVPDLGTFGVGDEIEIEIGGGYVLEHSSEGMEPDSFAIAGVMVPPGCAEHDIFLSR